MSTKFKWPPFGNKMVNKAGQPTRSHMKNFNQTTTHMKSFNQIGSEVHELQQDKIQLLFRGRATPCGVAT